MLRSSRTTFSLTQGVLRQYLLQKTGPCCSCLMNKYRKSSSAPASKSFAMNLFRGQIQVDQVFPYPEVLSEEQTETLKMFLEPTNKFFKEENDAMKNDELSSIDDTVMQSMKDLGAFGLQIPQDHGGLGLSNTQYARMTEVLGQYDLGIAITLGAHQSIGFKGILLFGNPEQKAKYLPDLASGKKIAAFCLTEPTSGSDASSIRTRAVLSDDGKHYILNGNKIWISNGGIAELFTVFAQTPCKDSKTGESRDKVTALIVERSYGGITSGPPEKKMGIKCSNTTEVYFEDVKVPVENVLAEPGAGFKVAMNILNNGRFGMASCMSGTMNYCIEKAVDFASNRTQFGKKIHTFGAIQEKISRMAIMKYVTESMAYMVSANMDQGSTEFQIEAAISKIYGSEAATFCADEAIQVLGGMGYMKESGLERVARDLRIFRIFEGTNDILRLFVALTGIQYAGLHLRELQRAFKNPAMNLGVLLGAGSKRAKKKLGISTSQSLNEYIHPSLATPGKQTSKAVEDFGSTIEDMLMKFGKGVVEEQFVLKRIGDSAIDIFGMVAVLSRTSRSLQQEQPSCEHEAYMCNVFCDEASHRISQNLRDAKSVRGNKNFKRLSQISDDIVKNGGLVHPHPLGF